MTEHNVGKVFDRDGDLIGGTVYLTPEEVVELEKTGSVEIETE